MFPHALTFFFVLGLLVAVLGMIDFVHQVRLARHEDDL